MTNFNWKKDQLDAIYSILKCKIKISGSWLDRLLCWFGIKDQKYNVLVNLDFKRYPSIPQFVDSVYELRDTLAPGVPLHDFIKDPVIRKVINAHLEYIRGFWRSVYVHRKINFDLHLDMYPSRVFERYIRVRRIVPMFSLDKDPEVIPTPLDSAHLSVHERNMLFNEREFSNMYEDVRNDNEDRVARDYYIYLRNYCDSSVSPQEAKSYLKEFQAKDILTNYLVERANPAYCWYVLNEYGFGHDQFLRFFRHVRSDSLVFLDDLLMKKNTIYLPKFRSLTFFEKIRDHFTNPVKFGQNTFMYYGKRAFFSPHPNHRARLWNEEDKNKEYYLYFMEKYNRIDVTKVYKDFEFNLSSISSEPVYDDMLYRLLDSTIYNPSIIDKIPMDYSSSLFYHYFFALILFFHGVLIILNSHRFLVRVVIGIEISLLGLVYFFILLAISFGNPLGQIISLVIISVSAVEAVIGLGLFLLLYNKRGDLDSDNISNLRG